MTDDSVIAILRKDGALQSKASVTATTVARSVFILTIAWVHNAGGGHFDTFALVEV
ncbi:MAG TPA: hypothetical protein VEO19_11910 [Terriglobia bacterium]|nr:hypothetical protein [Terriglobia bacterium]